MTILGLVVGAILAVAAFVAGAALRVAEHVLEDEIKARLPYAANKTLERALERLPAEYQEPRHREWTAELISLEGQRLRAVWFARQCLRAATTEAREYKTDRTTGSAVDDASAPDSPPDHSLIEHRRPLPRPQPAVRWDLLHTLVGLCQVPVLVGVSCICVFTFNRMPPLSFVLSELVIIGVSIALPVALRSHDLFEQFMSDLVRRPPSSSRTVARVDTLMNRIQGPVLLATYAMQLIALVPLFEATGGPIASPFSPLALAIPIFALFLASRNARVLSILVVTTLFYGVILIVDLSATVRDPASPPGAFLATYVLVLTLAAMLFLAGRPARQSLIEPPADQV